MNIILGSQSPARKELLIQAGFAPVVVPTYADESTNEKDPTKLVELLSKRKLDHLLQALTNQPTTPMLTHALHHNAPILTADTVVAIAGDFCTTQSSDTLAKSAVSAKPDATENSNATENSDTAHPSTSPVAYTILGKPKDRDHAGAMLTHMAGNTHYVHTGLCLWNPLTKTVHATTDRTAVEFFQLSQKEIENYLESNEWQGAAGAYRMQGAGIRLIKSIKGCHYNVAGLPLLQLFGILREQNFLPEDYSLNKGS